MKERLGVLDGLRGIAVLLVLWYHVWEISWLPAPAWWLQFIPETGFIGVHLFFFLSGFVISYPFVQAVAKGQPEPTWAHFAWRRFIKIVPSYWLSILVAYGIGYAATQHLTGVPVWKDIGTHLFFVHTWWPQTYGSINGVLWTLAVEVEFYLIFPFTWWCFKRRPWTTAIAMIAIATLWRTYWASCCFTTRFPTLSENLPGYLDIFACGMLAAWIFVHCGNRVRESQLRAAMPAVALAGFAMFVALLLQAYALRHISQWETASQLQTRWLFGVAFGVIALGSLCSPRWWEVMLANPPLRFMATISYNLYLYHQMFARELVSLHVPPYTGDPHFDPVWQLRYTVLAFTLTIAQAALVTYAFEIPLLRRRDPGLVRAAAGHTLSA
jgi:peptidoglycan/LPS O-acetylase OafA/YrhL